MEIKIGKGNADGYSYTKQRKASLSQSQQWAKETANVYYITGTAEAPPSRPRLALSFLPWRNAVSQTACSLCLTFRFPLAVFPYETTSLPLHFSDLRDLSRPWESSPALISLVSAHFYDLVRRLSRRIWVLRQKLEACLRIFPLHILVSQQYDATGTGFLSLSCIYSYILRVGFPAMQYNSHRIFRLCDYSCNLLHFIVLLTDKW